MRINKTVAAFFMAILIGISGCTLMKADMKIDAKEYDEAIPLLESYLADNPDSISALNKLGFAYLKSGQIANAVKTFKTALDKDPDDPYAVFYLGIAYLNMEKIGEAISLWKDFPRERNPIVGDEVKRHLTLLLIAQSQRNVKKALAAEKKLQAPKTDERTIAVCYFEDLSPDNSLKPFQKALAAMVSSDLAKIESLKVVERVRIQTLFNEMQLGQTGIVQTATAPRIGKLLGAEKILTGNVAPGSILAAATLSSAQTGGIVGTTSLAVEQKHFFDLSCQIVKNCIKIMEIELGPNLEQSICKPQTTNFESFITYGKALDAFDAGNWAKARNFFESAAEMDPLFLLATEGRDSCPPNSAPTAEEIAAMPLSDLVAYIEKYVHEIFTEQEIAELEAVYHDSPDSGRSQDSGGRSSADASSSPAGGSDSSGDGGSGSPAGGSGGGVSVGW